MAEVLIPNGAGWLPPTRAVGSPAVVAAVKIAASATVSEDLALNGALPALIAAPSGFTGTTFSLELSFDGGVTYVPLYDGVGNLVSWDLSASQCVLIYNSAWIIGATHLKIVAGSSQGADVEMAVACAP